MRRAGSLDPGDGRLAELVAVNACGAECILVLAPKPVIEQSSERPFLVSLHLLACDLGRVWARDEIAVSLAEPLLGPPASQRGCLARQVGPRGVHDRQPDSTWHQTNPENLQLIMESLPRRNAVELFRVTDASTRPAGETLDAPVRLEVSGLVVPGTSYGPVHPVKAKLLFEPAGKGLKRGDGLIRMMDSQRLGMNLVHGHVKMLVLLLAMANRDVLVLSEPRRLHRAADDVLELRRREASVLGVKRDDQVIGLVALGPHVAFLEQFHDVDRKLGVLPPIEAL